MLSTLLIEIRVDPIESIFETKSAPYPRRGHKIQPGGKIPPKKHGIEVKKSMFWYVLPKTLMLIGFNFIVRAEDERKRGRRSVDDQFSPKRKIRP